MSFSNRARLRTPRGASTCGQNRAFGPIVRPTPQGPLRREPQCASRDWIHEPRDRVYKIVLIRRRSKMRTALKEIKTSQGEFRFGAAARCVSRLREAAQSSNGNPAYCSATMARACFERWRWSNSLSLILVSNASSSGKTCKSLVSHQEKRSAAQTRRNAMSE